MRPTNLTKLVRVARCSASCAVAVAVTVASLLFPARIPAGDLRDVVADPNPGIATVAPGEEEARSIAVDAYLYGYPLVLMDVTRRVMTNVAAPDDARIRAPMFEFANAQQYPTAAYRDAAFPNADTLYSSAWLNLAREPWVLHVPDTGDRFYLMQMMDAWNNVFADPGTRTTGNRAGDFVLTGPGWSGKLPVGMREIKSPTNTVWILGRTYSTGTPADIEAVRMIQKQYRLTPLSAYGKSYTPPPGTVDPNVDMKTPGPAQVRQMSAAAYFSRLAALLAESPPTAEDAPLIARMARIGIVPGQAYDIAKLDPAATRGVEQAPKVAMERIAAAMPKFGKRVNGWQITPSFTSHFGTDYLARAVGASFGLATNLPRDAVYPTALVDGDGQPLSGANRYVLRFASRDALPPVNAFWSLTMYDEQWFFVANPINRYTLSQRNQLAANPDGSIDLYIQSASPGADKESNWLPAPEGRFSVVFRLYWPKENAPSILDGTWAPPPVTRVGP